MRIEKLFKPVIVLEKAIAAMVPDYVRPKMLPKDSVTCTAGKTEGPEHCVVVYKASQVLE